MRNKGADGLNAAIEQPANGALHGEVQCWVEEANDWEWKHCESIDSKRMSVNQSWELEEDAWDWSLEEGCWDWRTKRWTQAD